MNFGIMAMQMNELIPSGLAHEQLMAAITSFDHASLVRRLAGNGFQWIELGGDLAMFLPNSFNPVAIKTLGELKEELGVSYTVHLPLWSVEPSTPLQPVRQGSVKAVVESIQVTLPLDPAVYVLHATGALAAEFYRMRMSETARNLLLRQFQVNAHASLIEILNQSGLPSRRLAIETIEFPFELTMELAEELDLSICLDTGHVLVGFSGPIELFTVLERCLPRLAEIHLHDGPWQGETLRIGYGKDHQALGQGDLDTRRLFDILHQSGFKGPIIFELSMAEALASLKVIQRLFPQLAYF